MVDSKAGLVDLLGIWAFFWLNSTKTNTKPLTMSFDDFTYNEAVFFEIQANTPHKSLEKGSLPVVQIGRAHV